MESKNSEIRYLLLGSLACKIYEEHGAETLMHGPQVGYDLFEWTPTSDPLELVATAKGWGAVREIKYNEFTFLKQNDLIILEDGFCWKRVSKEQAKLLLKHEIMDVFGLSTHDNSEYNIEDEKDVEDALTLVVEVGWIKPEKED